MSKLSDKLREEALKALENRLVVALEQTPKGISDPEIQRCIRRACIDQKILLLTL